MSIIRKEQLSNPLSASYALTASYVLNASTSTIDTGSLVTTSSFNVFTSSINQFTSSYNTGSFSGSFTGSFFGTASWAQSASQALTASYTPNALITASVSSNIITFTKGDTSQFNITVDTGSGGTATPIGPDQSIQFKSGSNFSGSNNLKFDYTNNNIILTGSFLVTQSYISTIDYIDFTKVPVGAEPAHLEGRLHWYDDTKTLQIDTDKTNFMIEVGHQNVVRVYNDTGADIELGKVVRISGSQGNQPTVVTSSWTDDSSSATTLGFAATTISGSGANKHGYVITNGILRDVNTVGYPVGTQLYLSTSGDFTSTPPDAPLHEVRLGKVIKSNALGIIFVDIMNGYELTELHDVKTTNDVTGDLLIKSSSLWINSKQLTGSYGLTGSLTATSITSSLFGTASWAHSSSQALTASYINTLYSSNFTASFGLSTTWTINHNLNTRYVIVQTFDSNHNQLLPQDINLTNTNTATATFSAPESGYAIVTVGGALLNNATPGGSSGQVQYNNGGAFGGTSNFTFDGTYTELYGATGYKALSTLVSDYYTTTDLLNYRLLSTTYITDFTSNAKFAGDVLEGSVTATAYDLVFLQTTNTWNPVAQSDNAKATRMLGIYDGTNVFIEGYVVVGENGVVSGVPLITGTLTPGAPVYISGSANSAPFLDTTVPTSGVVRILGHLIRDEGSGYWFMKFRPDHTWVNI